MASPLIVKDHYPHKDFSSITQIGLKANNLAIAHQAEIDPRLPAGTLAGLVEDLQSLGAVVPGAKQAREEAKGATLTQNVALEQGYNRIRSIRKAVRKAGATGDVRYAYGVGQKVRPSSARDIKSALQQIVDRAKAHVDEAKGFGLLAADVASLEAAIAVINDAASNQATQRAEAPASTKIRNRTANRILHAAARIAGAGLIAFVNQPEAFADFEALMKTIESSRGSKKANSATKANSAAPGDLNPV